MKKDPAVFRRGLFCAISWAIVSLPAFGAESQATLHSGELQLVLSEQASGITIQQLLDKARGQDLLKAPIRPLFTLSFRHLVSSNEVSLQANSGWQRHAVRTGSRRLELNWSKAAVAGLQEVAVKATATADPKSSAIRWKFAVLNRSTDWTLRRVIFPDLVLAEPGSNAAVLFPRGPGEVQDGVWRRAFSYQGNYPDGWCSMQFVAGYAEDGTGLYVAAHDPFGSTKQVVLRSEPEARTLQVRFEHPAPDMGVAGNGFALEGEVVWQLLRGDWFDAAMIYKKWAQREARWWPRLGRDGRSDTPQWLRELNAWAMTGGAPADCVARVSEFRNYLEMPVGFHWYNWHQIPFDNDYPHYFPAKVGFAQGVEKLKQSGVHPMPYINGRLWDSKDCGAEDAEFSRLALAAVTKTEDGSAQLESYGSKETNGQPVRLGVMCPSTALWRQTVSNIVLRLLRECGTSGVYIDQIAAAAPKLCMDRSHGHRLGGGHWWTESYWRMLEDIRNAMPPGTMLTTECNAEPFIRWFDAYLTWHWQYDGQVPAFPAVYGGAVQMFGRAYRGGATKDLALRMKAGQQLVFGEQLGWLDPGLVRERENLEFFRQLAKIRAKFSRYFSAGEMARPPKLAGEIPQVKADWQWSGEWWVTNSAVLTGAWRLPKEHRLLLLFVNVGDQPVTTTIQDDHLSWGLSVSRAQYEVTFGQAPSPAATTSVGRKFEPRSVAVSGTGSDLPIFKNPPTFGPREVQAWEFRR